MSGDYGVDPAALRAARLAAGMTQHQLARVVGAAGGERISRWELGTSTPRPSTVLRLARALQVEPGDLLGASHAPDLRGLRLVAGLSTRQVAALAHVSEPTYRRWENGQFQHALRPRTIELLARALKVSPRRVRHGLDHARTDEA